MRGGDVVLMARRRAGLTQRELAERLGCRQATIARWERGDRHPSFEDAEAAADVCGLGVDVRVAHRDRSWWPQIAVALELDPVERVRRLTPPASADVAEALTAVSAVKAGAIVVGEVAGALHGWPLVLSGETIEVCARPEAIRLELESLGARVVADGYELPTGERLIVTDRPPGTAGFGDLSRGAEGVGIGDCGVQVAGLLDLLRIADASPARAARRQALAYRAVLDVRRAREDSGPDDRRSAGERIEAWLSQQIPVG